MAEKEEAAEAPEGKKKNKKKLIIFAVIGLLLVVVGAIAVPMFLGGSGEEGEEGHEEEDAPKVYLTARMESFIVNLSEQKNFLKITMLVEYDADVVAQYGAGGAGGGHGGGAAGGGDADPHALPPALAMKEPILRDAVIRVISSKRADDVLTVEGKESLKEEIIEALNDAIGYEEPPIVGVYFTEFIVQ